MIYRKGNILEAKEDAIGHGCNCKKVMRAGLALALSLKWPIVSQTDRDYNDFSGVDKIGRFSTVRLWNTAQSRGIQCYNIYTQVDFKPRGRDLFQYEGFRVGLSNVLEDMKARDLVSLALPKIGAGLAGGDWGRIAQIIEEVEKEYKQTVIIYELDRSF